MDEYINEQMNKLSVQYEAGKLTDKEYDEAMDELIAFANKKDY